MLLGALYAVRQRSALTKLLCWTSWSTVSKGRSSLCPTTSKTITCICVIFLIEFEFAPRCEIGAYLLSLAAMRSDDAGAANRVSPEPPPPPADSFLGYMQQKLSDFASNIAHQAAADSASRPGLSPVQHGSRPFDAGIATFYILKLVFAV